MDKWQVVEMMTRGWSRKTILGFAKSKGNIGDVVLPGSENNYCVQYGNMGVGVTCFWDSNYPNLLRNISDPPVALFYRGKLPIADEVCVGVVGSRDFSERGKKAARIITRSLVRRQITVVSGLAIGTDSIVHRECVSLGGRTIAVLPCGLDTVYPYRNRLLAEEIVATGGCLMSEYPVGTMIVRRNFLERNRIVSGLSVGVVVTEAGERSGSISTPNFAVDQGREVWCVGASAGEKNSEGVRRLVEDGASEIEIVDGEVGGFMVGS